MSLSQKITALTAAFAEEVVRALRAVPVHELAALSGKRLSAPPRAARTAPGPRAPRPVAGRAKARAKAHRKASSSAPPPDRQALDAALAFFVNRGPKGATGVQVLEHLRATGLEIGAADVLTDLAARGVIRDAGIRRATGKGTAAVYVASEP